MFESERRMDGLTYIFLLGVHYTCTLYTAENPLEIEISSNINIVVTLATLGTILLLGYMLARCGYVFGKIRYCFIFANDQSHCECKSMNKLLELFLFPEVVPRMYVVDIV